MYKFFGIVFEFFCKVRYICLFIIVLFSCEPDSESIVIPDSTEFNILSLGDSYTIGEGVCENCNYPNQLIDTLKILNSNDDFYVDIVAQTGWSTTALINNIGNELESNYDVVTLLIGVNNQFWNLSFETYENELIDLLNISKSKTKSGDFDDVVVIFLHVNHFVGHRQHERLQFVVVLVHLFQFLDRGGFVLDIFTRTPVRHDIHAYFLMPEIGDVSF